MNSINWPASSVWVFVAQLGEHCSANAEATGSNPVEAPKIFFSGYFRNCLNCDPLRWSHTHFKCNFYLPNSSIELDSGVVSIGLLNEKFYIFIVCVPQQKMSSINLFHASGFFMFCLKIGWSIFAIEILAKATAIFVPIAVPCI